MINESAPLHVTKLAAAKRQMDAAIRMFFTQEAELAIHTLAIVAAAFRVLRDEINKRGRNFGGRVLQTGFYIIAKEYTEGTLSHELLEMMKTSGIVATMEAIANRIRARGSDLILNEIRLIARNLSITGLCQPRWPIF